MVVYNEIIRVNFCVLILKIVENGCTYHLILKVFLPVVPHFQVDPLLNIHLAVESYCALISSQAATLSPRPSPRMLVTAYRVINHRIKAKSLGLSQHRRRLEEVVQKLVGLDGVIESWTKDLSARYNKMAKIDRLGL